MSRRLVSLSAGLLAASLALAGCGGSEDGDDGSTPSATGENTPDETSEPTDDGDDDGDDDEDVDASGDLVAWADGFCADMAPIEDTFTSFDEFSPDPNDPAAVMTQLQEMFAAMPGAFDAATVALQEAGPPPVDNGQQLYDDMITLFDGLSTSIGEVSAEISALDPNDPAAMEQLGTIMQSVGPEMDRLSEEMDTRLDAPELDAAFDEATNCTDLNMTD